MDKEERIRILNELSTVLRTSFQELQQEEIRLPTNDVLITVLNNLEYLSELADKLRKELKNG